MSDDSTWALSPECKELWDAINAYVVACAGNPARHVYGNTARMLAVGRVEDVVAALRSQIATLTAERDEARGQAGALRRIAETNARCATTAEARVAELEAELAKVRAALRVPAMNHDTAAFAAFVDQSYWQVRTDRDVLRARAEKAESALADMTAQRDAALADAERAKTFYGNGSCAEDCSRICHHLGCTSGVVRRDDGSRVCASGHVGRWVDRAELDAMRAQRDARPVISREDARLYLGLHPTHRDRAAEERVRAALRAHAEKVKP